MLIHSTSLVFEKKLIKVSAIVGKESLVLYSQNEDNLLSPHYPYLLKKATANTYTASTFKLFDIAVNPEAIQFSLFLSPKNALSHSKPRKIKAKPIAPPTVVSTTQSKPNKEQLSRPQKTEPIPTKKVTRRKRIIKPIKTANMYTHFPWLRNGYHQFEISRVSKTEDSRIKLAKGILDGKSVKMYFTSGILLGTSSIVFLKATPFAFHELYVFYSPRRKNRNFTYSKYSCYEDFDELAAAETRISNYQLKKDS